MRKLYLDSSLIDLSVYKPVEYLQTNSTAYIDTGIKGDLTTEIESVASVITAGQNGVTNIAGNNKDNTKAITINVACPNADQAVSRIRFGDTSTTIPAGTIPLDSYYKYTTNKNTFTAYNNSGSSVFTYNFNATTAFETTSNIMIGRMDDTGPQYIGTVRHKTLKITKNNTLVRDFYPVVRRSDNVAGMFDLVSKTFFINAGTGSFSVGDEVQPPMTKKMYLIKETNRRVPKNFTEVEYLQSSGTQYINTGFKPNQDTKVEFSWQYTTSDVQKRRFGYRNTNEIGGGGFLLTWSSGNFIAVDWDGQRYAGTINPGTTRHTEVLDKGKYYFDGSLLHTFTSAEVTCDGNAVIFAGGSGGSVGDFAKMKLYYCKIYDNGVLVRDFIPCLDASNVPCMYDTVTKTAFYNQGTGSFTYGHTITPVEYLESTGTQYIDIPYTPKDTSGMRAVWSHANNTDAVIAGARKSTGSDNRWFIGHYSSGLYFGWNTLISTTSTTNDTFYDCKLNFYNDRKAYIDAVEKATISSTLTTTDMAQMKLFYVVNAGAKMTGKLKLCQVTEGDKLIYDFIPVKDENNVGYMFDKVSHTLYANDGTGAFIVGNEITKDTVRLLQDPLPNAYQRVNYIESTGTQYIDTGIRAKSTLKTDIEFELTEVGADSNHIFGGRTVTSGGRGYGVFLQVNSNGIGFDYETRLSSGVLVQTGKKYRVVKDGASNILYVDGVQSFSGSNTSATFDLNVSMALFYMKDINTSFSRSAKAKVYYFKIWDNNTLVRNFIPVIRKSDNKAGMYDFCTKQFFGNSGTGSFNYG